MKKQILAGILAVSLGLALPACADVVGRTGELEEEIHRILAPNGQELYYVGWDEFMKEEEVNFDGQDDLVVVTNTGAVNFAALFFLWNGENYVPVQMGQGDGSLYNYSLMPEQGLVISDRNDGNGGLNGETILFRWAGEALVPVRYAVNGEHTEDCFQEDRFVTVTEWDRTDCAVYEVRMNPEEGREDVLIWQKEVPAEATPEEIERILEEEQAVLWEGL